MESQRERMVFHSNPKRASVLIVRPHVGHARFIINYSTLKQYNAGGSCTAATGDTPTTAYELKPEPVGSKQTLNRNNIHNARASVRFLLFLNRRIFFFFYRFCAIRSARRVTFVLFPTIARHLDKKLSSNLGRFKKKKKEFTADKAQYSTTRE